MVREYTIYLTRSNHRLGGRDNWTVRKKGDPKPHPNPHLLKEKIEVLAKADLQPKIDELKYTLKYLPSSLESAVWDLIEAWEGKNGTE